MTYNPQELQSMEIFAAQIARISKEIEHGDILVNIKVHNATPAASIATYAKSTKYKKENTTALADVMSRVKKSIDTKFNGSETFTLEYLGGNIDRITFDKNAKDKLV